MRHPAGSPVVCVNCERDGGEAPAGAAKSAAPPAAASAVADSSSVPAVDEATTTAVDEDALLVPPPSLRSRLQAAASGAKMSQPPAPAAPREVEASQSIADLMLEGWAMLQDHCPRWGGGGGPGWGAGST